MCLSIRNCVMYLSTCASSTLSSYFFTSCSSNFSPINAFTATLAASEEAKSSVWIGWPRCAAKSLTSRIVIGSPSTLATTRSNAGVLGSAGSSEATGAGGGGGASSVCASATGFGFSFAARDGLAAPGNAGADGAVTVEEAAGCLSISNAPGWRRSIEQPETAPARTIPSDATNAIATSAPPRAHRAAARGDNLLFCISLVDGRPDFRGRPVFQLFTARQGLQDAVELRKQLLVFSGFNSRDHLVPRRQPHRTPILVRELHQPRGFHGCIGMKSDFELRALEDCAHDHQLLHLAPDIHRRDQIFDQRRHRAEPIAQLVANLAELLLALRTREPPIEHQPLVLVGDVSLGDVRGHCDAKLGLEVGATGLAAQFGNRLFHRLGIGLEPNRRGLSVLLMAGQVACAAMFEVGHRELETAAALGLDQFTERIDSPLGVARNDVFAGNQQVCVRFLARTADAAAQLI